MKFIVEINDGAWNRMKSEEAADELRGLILDGAGFPLSIEKDPSILTVDAITDQNGLFLLFRESRKLAGDLD